MNGDADDLARDLDGGHWLLRGLAGSGKTAVLVARARHLRQRHPEWRVLVACFNPALAARLSRVLHPDRGLEITTLHGWLGERLARAGVAVHTPARGKEWDRYWCYEAPKLLLRAIAEGRSPASGYQAILVDEGQDFGEECYHALLRALDPATNQLVVAVDPLQNVYERRVRWPATGIDVTGRVRVLAVREGGARPFLAPAAAIVESLEPAEVRRELASEHLLSNGARPPRGVLEVVRSPSFQESRREALDWIRARLARHVPPERILVLGLSRLDMITVNAWLNSQNIASWLMGEVEAGHGVRVSTIHGSKGLDADHVLLLDAHLLDTRESHEARRLLYIALTRADQELCVSSLETSALVDELERRWRGA